MNFIYKYLLVMLSSVGLFSCSQDLATVSKPTLLNVKIAEVEYSSKSNPLLKSAQTSNMIDGMSEILWDDDLILTVNVKPLLTKIRKSATVTNLPNEREPIAEGVHVRLLVFDADRKFISSRDFTSGHTGATGISLYTDQLYNFVAYSFGELHPLPALGLDVGDDMDDALVGLNSIKDVMYCSELNVTLTEGVNNLELVLKHVFTKIKTSIVTSDVGTIVSVGNFSVSNVFNNAQLKFNSSINNQIQRIFNPLPATQAMQIFTILPQAEIAASPEQIIYVDGTEEQSLIVSNLKIGTLEKANVTLVKHVFQPGVYYDVEIKLKKIGHVVGPISYALGNLTAVRQPDNTYLYMPASTQGDYGDYWYKTANGQWYVIPREDQPGKNNAGPLVGATVANICGLIGPGWRVPTPTEALNLRLYGSWDQQYQPGGQATFVSGNYFKNGQGSAVQGLFFGTGTQPSIADQDKFLFLPFAGMYNSQNSQELGTIGSYWHNGNGNGGYSYQFASNYFTANEGGGGHSLRANSIRCVKDN